LTGREEWLTQRLNVDTEGFGGNVGPLMIFRLLLFLEQQLREQAQNILRMITGPSPARDWSPSYGSGFTAQGKADLTMRLRKPTSGSAMALGQIGQPFGKCLAQKRS
jgi:hypothetical protein